MGKCDRLQCVFWNRGGRENRRKKMTDGWCILPCVKRYNDCLDALTTTAVALMRRRVFGLVFSTIG